MPLTRRTFAQLPPGSAAGLEPDQPASRRVPLAAQLPGKKLDAIVVSAAPNVRYLTGFTGSNGVLLLWPAGAILFTDPRYEIQAGQETDCRVQIVRGPLFPALLKAAARKKFRRLGFEPGRLPYEAYEKLQSGLPLGASLVPAAGLVEIARMIKSEWEIALIRRSVLTNSKAFENTLARIRPGLRESEIAARLEFQMRLLGAEKPAFDTIVASGPRTALPHAQPTAEPVESNTLLLIDMGATQDGYASDMTRTVFLGRPAPKLRRLYDAVLEAQFAAIAAVRAGVTAGHVDRTARRVLRAHGLGKAFVHSTGHGLGLEIHEPPRIGKGDKTRLVAGMAITIEPGVYLEGLGGIRIEDTVVVTPSGCEVLTPTSKQLTVI
jgi:Xaa-Pro aminopeptidase